MLLQKKRFPAVKGGPQAKKYVKLWLNWTDRLLEVSSEKQEMLRNLWLNWTEFSSSFLRVPLHQCLENWGTADTTN